MSANSELKLYTIRVILATGLVQGCSMAKLDYGAIQPPPSPTLERLAEQDGALFHWLSAFEGVPVYSDPRCMKERGRITFLDEYHELWRNDTTVLLAEATDGGTTVSKIVGYAKRENLINSYERLYYCLHAQNRIARKVLVVKGWDGDLVSKKSMGFRHMPDAAAPIQGSVNLYDILYVYALKGDPNDPNGFCLVGNRPICDVGDFSTRQKCFLGWLTNKQVLFWDHREGVELNKSPDALAWRKEHNRPIQFFATREDIGANKPMMEEDLLSDRRPYYASCFPVLSSQPEVIDGISYLRMGIMGDSHTPSGRTWTHNTESLVRDRLERLEYDLDNVEIVLVIDSTGGWGREFQSVRESAARIHERVEKGRVRERPVQWAVMYYRDYTEEDDRDSFALHFVGFRNTRDFADRFPDVTSYGGCDNPAPLCAIDTAVKMAAWQKNSMRVVILIGDMGNEQPDKRGFTVDGVVKTLQDNHCEFFAIQTQLDGIQDRRIALFNRQAEEIAKKLGMPETKVFNVDETDVSNTVVSIIEGSIRRVEVLREILHGIKDGGFSLDHAVRHTLEEVPADLTLPENGKTVMKPDNQDVLLKSHILRRLPKEVDPNMFAEQRIQQPIMTAYAAQQMGECPYPSFNTRALMLRADFQQLAAVIGTVVKRGVNQGSVSEVWRQVVNQLSGDLGQEIVFDETRPFGEYMMMAMGIPVHSELLRKSVVEIMAMDKKETAKFREALDALWQKMNNYDNDMRVDGTATEPHWFLMHTQSYAWVPIELMP